MKFTDSVIAEIEEKIGYVFSEKNRLIQAFVRRSYVNENGGVCNEELEFLGDNALSYAAARLLSDRTTIGLSYGERLFSGKSDCVFAHRRNSLWIKFEESERELSEQKTGLVRRETLAAAIDRLDVAKYLEMSRGDVEGGVDKEAKVKEDLFEAIVGAVAYDSEWNGDQIFNTVKKMLRPDELLDSDFGSYRDYEKELRAAVKNFKAQGVNMKLSIRDCNDRNCYPEHSCICSFESLKISHSAMRRANSKKAARNRAAKVVLEYIAKMERIEEDILSTVGEPELEKAINQVQELWQKGIIEMPVYTYMQVKDDSKINNEAVEEAFNIKLRDDCWMATLCIDGFGSLTMYGKSKKDCKKHASYAFLKSIVFGKEYLTPNIKGNTADAKK